MSVALPKGSIAILFFANSSARSSSAAGRPELPVDDRAAFDPEIEHVGLRVGMILWTAQRTTSVPNGNKGPPADRAPILRKAL
jgi:hypothetical protein